MSITVTNVINFRLVFFSEYLKAIEIMLLYNEIFLHAVTMIESDSNFI